MFNRRIGFCSDPKTKADVKKLEGRVKLLEDMVFGRNIKRF